MYLNQLKYNGKVVGYRITGVVKDGKEVALDIPLDIARSVIDILPRGDVKKGRIVSMQNNGKMLVTDSEENVVEITSFDQCMSYIGDVCFPRYSSVEGISNDDELHRIKIDNVKNHFSKGVIVENDFSCLYDYDQVDIAKRRVNYLKHVLEKGGLTRFALDGFGFTENYSVELKCDVSVPTVKEYALMLSIIAGTKGLVSKPFKVDPDVLHKALVKDLGFDGYPVFNDDDDHDWDIDYLFGGHSIDCIGEYYLGGLVRDKHVKGKLVRTTSGGENLGNILRATVYLSDKNLKGSKEIH